MVKLYLPELLELFSNSYPLEAMMFTPNEDLEDLPEHLTTDRIVITHTSIESAIIATTCWDLEDTDRTCVVCVHMCVCVHVLVWVLHVCG